MEFEVFQGQNACGIVNVLHTATVRVKLRIVKFI